MHPLSYQRPESRPGAPGFSLSMHTQRRMRMSTGIRRSTYETMYCRPLLPPRNSPPPRTQYLLSRYRGWERVSVRVAIPAFSPLLSNVRPYPPWRAYRRSAEADCLLPAASIRMHPTKIPTLPGTGPGPSSGSDNLLHWKAEGIITTKIPDPFLSPIFHYMTDKHSRSFRLSVLQQRIDQCRVCESTVTPLNKPAAMDRGDPGSIVIVGEGPGRKELITCTAFAGPTGRRLEDWLIECGAAPADPRKGIHFTSVVKCVKNTERDLRTMIPNCLPFLGEQLHILNPSLIVTVGKMAYESVSELPTSYSDALCTMYDTNDHVLLTTFGFHFQHLVWPHPSPLNRWHNDPAKRALLRSSFPLFSSFLRHINEQT